MKYPILHLSFLPADGMALFPFILIKKEIYKNHKAFVNHERIHMAQQLELLLLGFYFLYLLHYLCNLVKFRNHNKAYLNIVFEKEAYSMESDLEYLKNRRFWAWMRFI